MIANRGGDGRTDGRMDGRTDVWKFPPVFYRTSALWGRFSKREISRILNGNFTLRILL